MKRKTYIVNLKYSPGLKKEFVLLGENLRQRYLDVNYLVANSYKKLSDINADGMIYLTSSTNARETLTDTVKFLLRWTDLDTLFTTSPPQLIIVYNFHPLNYFILRYVKNNFPKCITAWYFHEPFKPDKRSYNLIYRVFIHFIEWLQSASVKYLDHAILPSQQASINFKLRYSNFDGKKHKAPILVYDRQIKEVNKKRVYFSYVGRVHKATGFDTFIDLINYCVSYTKDFKFLVITSSNISQYLSHLTPEARSSLQVINKPMITDNEIDEVLRKSLAVFRFDHDITQSGVIPVSFMNSTPVIVRNLPGFTQHVKHKQNGFVVADSCTPDEIIFGMDFVQDNFLILSKNARSSYQKTWCEANWFNYYRWLFAEDVLSNNNQETGPL